MAIDAYMYFLDYDDKYLPSESQVDREKINKNDVNWKTYKFDAANSQGGLFEVENFSFDIEQTLNIGSQATGTGAGKVNFNPFSIDRKIDRSSPRFFNMACSGTPFKSVVLGARKAGGGVTSGIIYLVFSFKMAAVKTIAWSYDEESPKETVTFQYGGMFIHYNMQKPDGSLDTTPYEKGWNLVKNTDDPDWQKFIQ